MDYKTYNTIAEEVSVKEERGLLFTYTQAVPAPEEFIGRIFADVQIKGFNASVLMWDNNPAPKLAKETLGMVDFGQIDEKYKAYFKGKEQIFRDTRSVYYDILLQATNVANLRKYNYNNLSIHIQIHIMVDNRFVNIRFEPALICTGDDANTGDVTGLPIRDVIAKN